MVSRSSTEAEYQAIANGVAETSWLGQLLIELHSPLTHSTLVYCNNASAIYLASNSVQHQCTKHVEIDFHFVRDKVTIGEVHILHVPSTSQFTNIFTKGLLSPLFSEFAPVSTSVVAGIGTTGEGIVLEMLYYSYLGSETTCYMRVGLAH
jgi:hypothetical protein